MASVKELRNEQIISSHLDQASAIYEAVGLDIGKPVSKWSEQHKRLPPKALWQILMAKFTYDNGIEIGDQEIRLFNPTNLDAVRSRVNQIITEGNNAWVSSATWKDPLSWDHRATKPKLWKNISGLGKKATPWEQFATEVHSEREMRPDLILKSIAQNNEYKILNMRLNPGSIWKHPEGWSIHIEWYQETDSREGDHIIPRSFLISSDPTLNVVCGESTLPYARKFIQNNLLKIGNILKFWHSIDQPPAVFECMRQNGNLTHLNDISIELPPPSTHLLRYLKDYSNTFILPLYDGKVLNVENQLLEGITSAPWVSAREWNIYNTNSNRLSRTSVNEGHPENSQARTIFDYNKTVFDRTIQSRAKFLP